MQAIYTKYLPPSNTRSSRIKATCDAGSLTIPYPHGFDEEGAHVEAARLLCVKLDDANQAKYGPESGRTWSKPKACGGLPGNGGYAHVFQTELMAHLRNACALLEGYAERYTPEEMPALYSEMRALQTVLGRARK